MVIRGVRQGGEDVEKRMREITGSGVRSNAGRCIIRGPLSILVGLAILSGACAPTAAPAPATAAVRGPLRVAFEALGSQALDPLVSETGNKVYLTLMYDWLVDIDPQSNLDPKRSIAESSTLSSDKKVHTYKIRKGVKFHDGSELSSADVKFSIERIIGPNAKSGFSGNLRDQIAKIEAPDVNTVIVTTKASSVFLDYDFSPLTGNEGAIVPKAYVEKNGDAYFQSHPIGSGPFKYVDSRSGDYIKLTAFDGYWKFRTTYQDVALRVVPEESTRAALLQRGEVDIISVSSRKASELVKAGFNKLARTGNALVAIPYDQWLPPFTDKRIRQALNLAVDRKALNDSLFEGTAALSASYPVNSSDIGYKPEPLYDYDPERAKALLKEPGVPAPKIVALSWTRDGIDAPRITAALVGMWQAVGFQVEVKVADFNVIRDLRLKGQPQAGAVGVQLVGGRVIGTSLMSSVFLSTGSATTVKDPNMDQFITRKAQAPDVETYKAVTGEAADYIRQNDLMVPLLETGDIYLMQRSITPWNLTKTPYSADLLNLVEKR